MSSVTRHDTHVAVFGKHPGWDDHIDDIGLETAGLVALKRALYVEGIGGNIDAGAWERLDDTQRLEGFASAFLSLSSNGVIVGRLWSSVDGKGRSRYPMVACAQCPAQSLLWVLERALPRLEGVEKACRAVRSAEEVQGIVGEAREKLAQAAEETGGSAPSFSASFQSGQALVELAETIDATHGQSAFRRVLYKIDRDMPAFHKTRKGNGKSQPPAQMMRAPAGNDDVVLSLATWTALMLCLLRPGTDLFAIRSLKEPWVDIIVGPPRVQQIYCLRASRKAVPLATDVPYGMDSSFVQQSDDMLESWRNGKVDVLKIIDQATAVGGRTGGVAGLFSSMFGGK